MSPNERKTHLRLLSLSKVSRKMSESKESEIKPLDEVGVGRCIYTQVVGSAFFVGICIWFSQCSGSEIIDYGSGS